MLPGRNFGLDEILHIAAKRRWLILLPLAIGLAAAPVIERYVPELYRSETLIMVIPQRVPDSYVRSTVTTKIEERLPAITGQIQSRTRLERIITDFDLYKSERARKVMEDVVEEMRSDIKIKIESRESFRVTYYNEDARTAQKVTERLASFYIEENLRDRENQAESTSQFLEAQLEDSKRRLLEYEKKLEDYRRRHSGQLPSQLQSNLQMIQSSQLQLQAVSEAVNRARERRLLVERQLADAQALPLSVSQPGLAASLDQPEQVPMTPAQQLEITEARLETLKMRYKPDHPDIRAMERAVRDLQARLAEESSGSAEPAPERAASRTELARQKRIRDFQAELEIIDRQIATSEREEARLRRTMGEYQAKVDALPSRESELVELTRDYTTLQETYATLLAKKEESKVAANLERRQIGEQFRVLDPASFPEKPYNQMQRIALTASGAIAGLILGLGLVGFLEYRDSTFKHEHDVLRLLNLPVLALVPSMPSKIEQQAQRRRTMVVNTAATGVLIASAVMLILWRLQP